MLRLFFKFSGVLLASLLASAAFAEQDRDYRFNQPSDDTPAEADTRSPASEGEPEEPLIPVPEVDYREVTYEVGAFGGVTTLTSVADGSKWMLPSWGSPGVLLRVDDRSSENWNYGAQANFQFFRFDSAVGSYTVSNYTPSALGVSVFAEYRTLQSTWIGLSLERQDHLIAVNTDPGPVITTIPLIGITFRPRTQIFVSKDETAWAFLELTMLQGGSSGDTTVGSSTSFGIGIHSEIPRPQDVLVLEALLKSESLKSSSESYQNYIVGGTIGLKWK